MSDAGSPREKKKRKRKKEKKKKKDKKKKKKKEDRWCPDEPELVFGTDGDGEKVIVNIPPSSGSATKKKKKKSKHKSKRHSSMRENKSGSPSSTKPLLVDYISTKPGADQQPPDALESPTNSAVQSPKPEPSEALRGAESDAEDLVKKTPSKRSRERIGRKPEHNKVDLREELNAARSRAKGEP